MLLLFWIPILLSKFAHDFFVSENKVISFFVSLVVIACGLYQGIPVVLTSAQDLAKVVQHNR